MTRLARALALLVLLPALAVTASPAAASPARTAAPVDDAFEARVVHLANAHRKAAGLRPLRVSACADRSAEDWSATMARTAVLAHRPSLKTVLTTCRARSVGENIAYGAVSADRLVAMWMASPGHRANILSSRFTHVGVGADRTGDGRTYGTQVLLQL